VAYHASTLVDLERARARGQRPEGFVVVGTADAAAWAARNRFFFVDERDLREDLTAFSGIDVLIRTAHAVGHQSLAQQLAMVARAVTVFDTRANYSLFLRV
jgi:hypothetical protein